MDPEVVIGAAGFVVTATAAAIAWAQLRRTPAPGRALPAPENVRSRAVLRPPTGRLPGHVRGRADVLRTVDDAARRPDGTVHVLGGLGGTGKTTIALRAAEACLDAGLRVWWVSGADPGALAADLLELARVLGASAQDVEDVSRGRRNPADVLWEVLDAQRDWVLVIDNADDPGALAVDGRTAADGSGWIRPAASGLVLVTSRTVDPLVWGRHAVVHDIGWLPAEAGARMLLDLAPGAGTAAEARALAERLGGLPLALRHAGLHLASPFNRERSFTAYAMALRDRFPELMRAGTDDRSVVASTWRLTLDALADGGRPDVAGTMHVLARLAGGAPFPCDLLDHATIGARAAENLRALANTGMITLALYGEGGVEALTVHPLVVEVLRHEDDEPGDHMASAARLLAAAAGRLDPRDPEHGAAWASLVPHASELLEAAASRPDEPVLERMTGTAARVALALLWTSRYFTARAFIEESLSAAVPLGPGHPAVLTLRLRLSMALRLLGSPADAEPHAREVAEARGRSSGPTDPSALDARHEVGLCLSGQGRHAEAQEVLRAVVADRRDVLGEEHQDTLVSLTVLARLPVRLGRLDESEEMLRDVYATQSRVLGARHPDTVITRKYIGQALAEKQLLDDAEAELTEVLPELRRLFGAEHGDVLSTQSVLAGILAARGKKRAARRAFEELLSVQRRVLGAEHPGTRKTERAIAEL
ncbi:tetratricopeptide repeat protein [Actinomadura sp. WMMB 499]|uniref:tetratricopeptide repeat protein n=1 Tax=Actinomadura sp. WMMB 499 TaxID=1219491 RepID=UPI0012490BB3|nr:tetratricopeptide repeat protein [Actinomadura sp. WMMB 499]QFG23500.1 tetratricopeptide repeat protein [Actinomadura sp. WMMB 499]